MVVDRLKSDDREPDSNFNLVSLGGELNLVRSRPLAKLHKVYNFVPAFAYKNSADICWGNRAEQEFMLV